MKKFFVFMLFMATCAIAGSVQLISNNMGHKVYFVKPDCRAASLDTCGPIALEYSKYFSANFLGQKLIHKDTAIVDSGFKVRIYMSHKNNASALITPKSADSLLNFFGLDSIQARLNGSVGLSITNAPYIYVVFSRWDTNADTLDWKRSDGTRDTAFVINLFSER